MTDESNRQGPANRRGKPVGDGGTTPAEPNSAPEDTGSAPSVTDGEPSVTDGGTTPSGDDPEWIRARFVEEACAIETPAGDLRSSEVLQHVDVADGIVSATVDLSNLETRTQNRVGEQLRGIGLSFEGVDHVRIEGVDDRPDGLLSPTGVDRILVVAGSKGGVGKSTITLALARYLTERGLDVGVFDADFQAPDVTALLELEDPLGASATGRVQPADVDGVQVVSLDLIAGERPGLWRGAMVHDALVELLGNAAWDDRDVVLVDVPPGHGDVAHGLFSRVAVDGAFVVTTPADVSVRNVERTVGALEGYDVPVRGVIENLGDGAVIHEGMRDLGEAFSETSADPVYVTVPFDSVLQRPAELDVSDLSNWARDALRTLDDVVHSELADRDVPTDAVDLTGLPESLCERQAILELTQAPDGPRPLLVSNRPALLELFETEERTAIGADPGLADATGTDLSVHAVGDDRLLIECGGETA